MCLNFVGSKGRYPMRIALLHLDLAGGPREKNEKLLLKAIEKAGKEGASVIVTPETALEGYYFYERDKGALEKIPIHDSEEFLPFRRLAKKLGVSIFLSAVEKMEDDSAYNSCFYLSPQGEEQGVHRKMYSHQSGAEGWLTLGDRIHMFPLGPLKAGLLVCADVYYEKPCIAMKEGGADMVLVSAAWPPASCCPDPMAVWKRASLRCDCPVIVCNQTGKYDKMDMTIGESAAVSQGKGVLSYRGKPATLIFDFDEKNHKILSHEFQLISM